MTNLPEIDLSNPEFAENPNKFFKLYREHAPVFYMQKYQCWLIGRHAEVKQALNDPVFSRDPNHSNNLNFNAASKQWEAAGIGFFVDVLANKETHARNRQLIHSAFKPQKIGLMQEIIETTVEHYFKNVTNGGIVDLVDEVITPIP